MTVIETHPAAGTGLDAASDLVTQAARLLRLVRRVHEVPATGRVLSILDENGPLGVSALADLDRCSQPTMSTAVSALVADGLADKRPHPTDARSSVVSLTEAGRRELVRTRRLYGQTIAERLAASGRSEHDLATAVAVLRDVVAPTPEPQSAPQKGTSA